MGLLADTRSDHLVGGYVPCEFLDFTSLDSSVEVRNEDRHLSEKKHSLLTRVVAKEGILLY